MSASALRVNDAVESIAAISEENSASAEEVSAATLAVWAGEDESLVQGATQVPIVYSAAYGYPDVDAWLDVALGRKPGHIYSRNTNPTVHAFEEKLRILEGAAAATSFSTGMAAISASSGARHASKSKENARSNSRLAARGPAISRFFRISRASTRLKSNTRIPCKGCIVLLIYPCHCEGNAFRPKQSP